MTTIENPGTQGLGLQNGYLSELSAPMHVLPGHADELRAASGRFQKRLQAGAEAHPEVLFATGIRSIRHIIFDGGTRFMWLTSFETEWDPYIDDSLEILGVDSWVDYLQHTQEFADSGLDTATVTHAQVKEFIQGAQVPATAFFESLADLTMPEVRKAGALQDAFDQVLDAPGAQEALSQPALAPLLARASV